MEKIHKKTLILGLSIFVFFFAWFCVKEVQGASVSLYLSPPSGTYAVESTFSIKVKVDSGGATVNAAEGTVIFNPAELQVVSLSKSGSIFTLWTTEPTFSNSLGNISFGGGTPSSFTGSSGTILTIKFKAKASASAQVSFSSGSVLAADGKGTNVLASMNGGVYTLKSEIVTPPAEEPPSEDYVPPPTPTGTPAAPVIFSSTHSDPEKWYSNDDPEFSWKLPSDVTGVSLLLHKKPFANPGSISDGLMESKKFEDVEDGIWYFHIKFKNKYGWGQITHRKVLIDTIPPEPFEIEVDNEGDSTNPTPILHFATTDSLSGVEYYELKIRDEDAIAITAAALEHNPFQMAAQLPGTHRVIATAIDAAGNSTSATIDLEIEPIETPVITDLSQTAQVGDNLIINGTSKYPDATVTVFVKKEGEDPRTLDVKTDKQGNWTFIYDKSLEKGTYQVWMEITDIRGAKSYPTEKITITAALPAFIKFGKISIDYLTIVITLIALIVFLILIIGYGWYKISIWRKRLKKETREIEENLIKAFRALREEVQEQIEYLDKKKGLSRREKQIRNKLNKALKISEEFIGKEIKDVLRELE